MSNDDHQHTRVPQQESPEESDKTLREMLDNLRYPVKKDPDKTLRELQTSLPWTAHYHRDFRATPMTHKDFAHALIHVHKAGGKLAAIIDEAEHAGYSWADPEKRAEVEKYIADLVICALRMATTCPDGQIDLQQAVQKRLTAKNNQLAEAAPALREAERK